MLRRFSALRFAHNVPLERERRLLRISASGNNLNPQEGTLEKQIRDIQLHPSTIEAITKWTQERTGILLGTETDPTIVKALRSEEVSETIQDALPSLQVLIDEKANEMGQISSEWSPETREKILRDILRDHPRQTYEIAFAIHRRIDQHAKLMESIDNKLNLILGSIRGEKTTVSEWDTSKALSGESMEDVEKLRTLLARIPSDQSIGQLNVRKTQHETEMTDSQSLLSSFALESYFPDTKDRDLVTDFFVKLEATEQKRSKFGLKPETLNNPENLKKESTWQNPYLAELNDSGLAYRKYLALQLQTKAITLVEENDARRQRINQELAIDESTDKPEASRRSLERFGVEIEALETECKHIDIVASKILGKLDEGSTPPPEKEDEFLSFANTSLKELDDIQKATTTLEKLLSEERDSQKKVDAWFNEEASKITEIFALSDEENAPIRRMFGEELFTILERLQTDRTVSSKEFTPERRQRISKILRALTLGRDAIKFGLENGALDLPALSSDPIEVQCQKTRDAMQNLLGDLLSPNGLLHHPLENTVRISDAVKTAESSIRANTDYAKAHNDPEHLQIAMKKLEELRACKALIVEISGNIIETDDPSLLDRHEKAAFVPRERKIFIRRGLASDDRATVLEHEMGHAILFALRKSGLAPFILTPLRARLQVQAPNGDTFEKLLEQYSDRWGIEDDLNQRIIPGLQAEYPSDAAKVAKEAATWKRQELLEELIMKHLSWVSRGQPVLKDADLEMLFALLEKKDTSDTEDEQKLDLSEQLGARRRETDDVATEEEAEALTATASEKTETANMKQNLIDISRNIAIIKNFQAAYPQYKAMHDQLEPYVHNFTAQYHELDEAFLGKHPDKYGDNPEGDPRFIADTENLKKSSSKVVDAIREFDVGKLDITAVQKTGKRGLLDNIEFVSILDLMKLWNDTKEDIKGIYTRAQDRKLQKVGESLTNALYLGRKTPFAGKYMDQLKGYHTRRYAGAEQEAADKWKDGLKNEDSHAILHMFPHTTNKDQIRGMISLLTERGDMDWNDRGILEKLGELSGLPVPIDACLRDDVLRDTWYRRMVTEIWTDKELYYEWRAHNDDHIGSAKKHFTTFVDQLSNVRKGMASELGKQLRLQLEYLDRHHHGDHTPPPEDIKPHLYEEIIDYAIRNGKMSMEQKFYYLVRGVATGILSIDRLRALAGEHGGFLNQFPFIDYFYQKNNSLPEIQALSDRLVEKKGGKDTHAPGVRTTLWLHLEVSREKSVQDRLSKGTSKTGAENIDHEDIPFFLPQLDYNNGVRNLADVISGSRQKVSPEGWKNAYVGYSSKFKIFGRLAQMDKNNLERFTQADAKNMAQTIAAYIDMDNILTRNGFDKDSRPSLSENQLDSMAVSGDDKHTTKQYRSALSVFMKAIINKYGTAIEQNQQWQAYKEKTKIEAGTDPADPKKKRYDYVTLDKFAPIDGKYRRNENEKMAQAVFKGTPYFVNALQEAIMNDLDGFKALIAEFSDSLYDEGGSAGKTDYEDVRDVFLGSKRRDIDPNIGLEGHTGEVHH